LVVRESIQAPKNVVFFPSPSSPRLDPLKKGIKKGDLVENPILNYKIRSDLDLLIIIIKNSRRAINRTVSWRKKENFRATSAAARCPAEGRKKREKEKRHF